MGGWIPIETVELECPFCHKMGISAQYFPPSKQAHTSRSAGGKKTKIYKVNERYEGITDCPNCGKKSHEIKKALEQGTHNPENEKKVLERLKSQGIDFTHVQTKF